MYSCALDLTHLVKRTLRNRANQLSLRLISRHLPVRFLDLLPRQHLLDKHLERPVLELRQRMLNKLVPQLALILLVAAPQPRAFKARPLAEEKRHIRLLELRLQLRARQRSEIDDRAVLCDRSQVGSESFGTDEIDDNIYALAVGGFEDFVGPVGLLGVERCCCAELGGDEGGLFVAAGGGVDGGCVVAAAELDAGDGD